MESNDFFNNIKKIIKEKFINNDNNNIENNKYDNDNVEFPLEKKENLELDQIIAKTFQEKNAQKLYDILNDDSTTLTGEDKFGNNRGYCKICKEICPSYTQSGIDDLRCGNCKCGASAHILIPIEEFDLKVLESNINNDFIPRLNQSITEKDLNFNSFIVIFKILDKNDNPNQYSWLYQLFRESGLSILNVQIKQINENVTFEGGNVQLNYFDINREIMEKSKIIKKDTTFSTMNKLKNKLKYLTYSNNPTNSNNENINLKNTLNLSNSNIYQSINLNKTNINVKKQTFSNTLDGGINKRDQNLYKTLNQVNNFRSIIYENVEVEKVFYEDFKNPVLILCLAINPNQIQNLSPSNYFSKFWIAINQSDKSIRELINNKVKLLYISKTKLNALWDVQIMFPDLFMVDQMFQLLICKKKHEENFDRSLSLYKDGLLSNSFNLINLYEFDKLSELKDIADDNIRNAEKTKKKAGLNVSDVYDNYLSNQRFSDEPCAIMQISSVGLEKEIKDMSTSLAFNSDFNIIRYDDENECEELNNFFFNKNLNSSSSYERVFLLLRPFILRSGLHDILMNILKINKFNILSRKILVLNETQISYLYHNEFPSEAKISFELYHRMMSDGNCEILILSKLSAFCDLNTLIGYSVNQEINVNQYNTITNYLSLGELNIKYGVDEKYLEKNDPLKRLTVKEHIKNPNNSGLNSKSSMCFKDISSLFNLGEMLNKIMKDKAKMEYNDTYTLLHTIKKNLLKFSSFFNLFVYSNVNQEINQQEINYFIPKYGEMQEIFLMAKNYEEIKNILILLKFEILDTLYYRLNEEEFDRLFQVYIENYHNNYENKNQNIKTSQITFVTEDEYDYTKEKLLNNDVVIFRLIKPGGFYELTKIIGKENYKFIKKENINELKKSIFWKEADDYLETLKNNTYLIDNSINIEYFYPMINNKVFKIEGSYIIENLKSFDNQIQILPILESCLKCTVGENIRFDSKQTIHNLKLIERYLKFYHFHYQEKEKMYFLNVLNQYMFPNFNKDDNNSLEGKYYEIIKNNKIIQEHLSYFIESSNLSFFEIRIPILENFCSNGWNYIDMMKYLMCKNYLYIDNNFYENLVLKWNNNKILINFFPYNEKNNKGNISKYLKLNELNQMLNTSLLNVSINNLNQNNIDNTNTININNSKENNINNNNNNLNNNNFLYNSLDFNMLNIINNNNSNLDIEDNNNIQRRFFYFTKYESTKHFYRLCHYTNPKSRICPENYHYRIKPDDIYMDINRIYEVEEFGGLFFIEMVMQDYMKYRPPELNEIFMRDNTIRVYSSNNDYLYDDKIQNSLPGFLWGRKLMKIVQLVEAFDWNKNPNLKVEHFGPICYYPFTQKVQGIINQKNIIEYEQYLYINIIDDLRVSNLIFDEDIEFLEKKLLEVFNTDIYKKTRSDENNIRLMPTRIQENNLRVNKTNKNDIVNDINSSYYQKLDPKHEMNFHKIFKDNERKKEISIKILSKNVYLIDLFCFNGMKYHMFAAFLYLINVYYKKLNRRKDLITIPINKLKLNSIDKEYDLLLESILTGFLTRSYINYKNYNDDNCYNAYRIEYFFYTLKELKYKLNEIEYLNEKLNTINNVLNNGDLDDIEQNEFLIIKNNFEQKIKKNISEMKIIINECKNCPLKQDRTELDEFTYIYAPKERYYIPMYIPQKWERDLNNEKYMRTYKIEQPFLKKLKRLQESRERETFSKSGFGLSNDYYLIQKTMLREPEPELEKRILLEKKRNDKTKLEQRLFGDYLKKILKPKTKKDEYILPEKNKYGGIDYNEEIVNEPSDFLSESKSLAQTEYYDNQSEYNDNNSNYSYQSKNKDNKLKNSVFVKSKFNQSTTSNEDKLNNNNIKDKKINNNVNETLNKNKLQTKKNLNQTEQSTQFLSLDDYLNLYDYSKYK